MDETGCPAIFAALAACEAQGIPDFSALPPVGSAIRHRHTVATVIEHGAYPADAPGPHRAAVRTSPETGDVDWGDGYDWIDGDWDWEWEVAPHRHPC